MNNFLGFSESEERRTDGIFGLFKASNEYENEEDEELSEPDTHAYATHKHNKSNEDLFNVLDNNERNRNMSASDLYNKYSQKKVTFSTDNLDFRNEDIPPLINEQPDPVVINNFRRKKYSRSNSKKSRSNSAKKSVSWKGLSKKNQSLKAKKPQKKSNKGRPYKARPKPKQNNWGDSGWNNSTVTSGFFGRDQELKSKRPLEEPKVFQHHSKSSLKVKQESRGSGKFYVDFVNDKGQKTSSFQMNKDLMSLNDEMQNKQLQNMKYSTKALFDKKSSRSRSQNRSHSRPKQRSVSRQERETNVSLGAIYGSKNSGRRHQDDSKAIEQQVAKNFNEKENLIKMLSQELNQERQRRKMMDDEFKNQFNEFQSEMNEIKQMNQRVRSKPTAENINTNITLDMVPTRDRPIPKGKAHQIKTHKPTPYKSTFGKPISHTSKYKNVKSKLKEHMKMPDSLKQKKIEEAERAKEQSQK